MVVDIAPQQQLNEVFTTTRIHHRSSSSSIHRRSSTATNTTSSLVSAEHNTMTNGDRSMSDELSKKAEQILGQATDLFACRRQNSLDFQSQHAPRLNITTSKPTLPSRNNLSNSAHSTTVNNPTSSQSVNPVTLNSSNGKNKRLVTVEHLAPLILQLVATPTFIEFPEMISRHRSNSKSTEKILQGREMTLAVHQKNALQLSDDENEEDENDNNNNNNNNDDDDDEHENDDDDHNTRNSTTVLTEIIDNKTNSSSSSINQQNSNDNPLLPPGPHAYENQTEPQPQHSGISSSRSQDDDDSEDEDSDNSEAAHSDAENEDEQDETNPKMLSLIDFVRVEEIHSEPVESSLKSTSDSFTNNVRKRSISPETRPSEDNHVHNSEEHQNKRKKLLIKRALLESFVSSVNTKINFKQPSLPITIPTYLFFNQTSTELIQSEDERRQRTSKRCINGTLKHDPPNDTMENSLPLSSSSSSSNNQTIPINGIHQKKNKTSHVQEKTLSKQDSTIISTNEQTIMISNTISSNNEIDSNKTRGTILSTNNTATVSPIIAPQPKKEKPTANVKPLLQSTPMDNLSLTNSINNGITNVDSLTTNNSRSILPSNKMNYAKLKNMSKTELAALARKKKKQADCGKRTTFSEAREAMGLYLESVCYFIQCANEETKQDQRTSLLTTTLTMLQQLAQNHKKMFHISNSNQSGDLYGIQQKFLLINYWLQSLIYHLQFNSHMPTIERHANQVTDYFNQLKPSSSTRNTNQQQQQSTPINDTNPISPLSTASQTSSSDISSNSGNEQHRYIYDFSKLMLHSYHSTYYWNKAENLMREKTLKEFAEQLLKQNQNRRLSRDDPTLEFILYIFDSIELLRLSVA